MDKTDLISKCIIFFCAGVFISFVLTMIFVKNTFNDEIIVKVTPYGIARFYNSGGLKYGRIDRQEFKVVFKNGRQVRDERLGYAYKDINASEITTGKIDASIIEYSNEKGFHVPKED